MEKTRTHFRGYLPGHFGQQLYVGDERNGERIQMLVDPVKINAIQYKFMNKNVIISKINVVNYN